MRKFLNRFSLSLPLLLSAQDLLACAVCTSNEEVSGLAYLRSTLMLSIVPLIAMGGVAYFIYRNMKRAKAKE